MPSSGLYSVIFGTPQGEIGGGIVVSHGGKVQGGDITYFYDGSVQEEGSRVIAHVLVQKYQQTGESVLAIFLASGSVYQARATVHTSCSKEAWSRIREPKLRCSVRSWPCDLLCRNRDRKST